MINDNLVGNSVTTYLLKNLTVEGELRTINEIEGALKAFKIAVEAAEMTGFKVRRLPAASKDFA
jgi:hypothetical protein